MTLRFGTDGVRGVAVCELTPADVLALGRATARVLGGDRLLVARDPRRSGSVLEAALAAGAASEGRRVERLGVLPTPGLAVVAATEGVPAAMITASHNPFEDNGVKLFGPGGAKLSEAQEREIEALMRALPPPSARGAEVGEIVERADAVSIYAGHLLARFSAGLLAGLRVVVDTANGAMSQVAPMVLQRLGADVVAIHAEPDGCNINAGCGATAPSSLAAAVRHHRAEVGLAFDGDGDRVIAVDHTGAVVDGDRLIALSAIDRHERGELVHDTVVVTVMTNLGFHRAMAERGITVVTTPVGDRAVLQAMQAGGYVVGGEQSGHIIHLDEAPTGDGLLAGLVLLDLVCRSGQSLADLARDVMVTYPQVLVNVKVTERHPDIAELLAPEIAELESRLGEDGRVLVRASGTEPLVRIMVEAPTEALAATAADELARVVAERW
jgi:phosphoglucosamine mutase